MSISARDHDLISLVYRFLRLQPFGWEGPGTILQSERFELPAVKAHQARCHRLLLPTAAPMIRLNAAVFALWMARDDAHIAAWRAEGLLLKLGRS